LRALLALAGAPPGRARAFEPAFVHESAVKERLAERSNERLEFLGDAVLGCVAARYLYERYPAAPEGELALRKSSLVSDAALASSAERLEFDALLVLGRGLAKLPAARRRSVLADAFEAFVAVLYLACGFEIAEGFVTREHIAEVERIGASLDDPKTLLQEWAQKRYATLPSYADRFEGPDHDRTFVAQVSVNGEALASGAGPSKKAAQRAAAAAALETLRSRYDDVQGHVLSQPAPRTQRKGAVAAKRRRS
jgi:ribonuclease-3